MLLKTQCIEKIRHLIEVHAFGVCSYLGEKLGIPSRYIRLYFVYAVFVVNWSPIIIYMSFAFLINLKDYIKEKKNASWDL